MADNLELKAWPFFGYAPGNYMAVCADCGGTFSDLDKRAISCLECAVKRSKAYTAALARTPTPPAGDVVERVAMERIDKAEREMIEQRKAEYGSKFSASQEASIKVSHHHQRLGVKVAIAALNEQEG